MGYFGYRFIDLTQEDVAARRIILDRYAFIAQCSVFVVVFAAAAARFAPLVLGKWIAVDLESRSSSPQKKYVAEGHGKSWIGKAARRARKVKWFLGADFIAGYGTRAQWIGGIGWAVWLGVLCVNDTGEG
jgi:hypothetical protein